MKTFSIYLLIAFAMISLLSACGPSQQEQQAREQARQDSLERVRQQQLLEQQRMDSIAQAQKRAQARADSIAAAQKAAEEAVKFDPNGPLSVQVGAWRSQEKAQAQVSTWKERGFPNAYVVQYGQEGTGNIWFRVRLGRLASKDLAEKLGSQLQSKYNEKYWIAAVSNEGAPAD